ncbi:MAG: cytochrome c [Proteobacteria bacterium]|nr:cytochrome c [Pseudomonadota bacterium]
MTKSRLSAGVIATVLLAALATGCSPDSEGAESGDANTAPTSSSAGLPSGNIVAGEERANAKGAATGQSCIDCHGANGNAPIDPSYPKLGGQYADYLAYALQTYRNGTREHPLMAAQAQNLSDQQIADLSVWFASRPSELTDLHGAHQ